MFEDEKNKLNKLIKECNKRNPCNKCKLKKECYKIDISYTPTGLLSTLKDAEEIINSLSNIDL